jgi:hypothetical protein
VSCGIGCDESAASAVEMMTAVSLIERMAHRLVRSVVCRRFFCVRD